MSIEHSLELIRSISLEVVGQMVLGWVLENVFSRSVYHYISSHQMVWNEDEYLLEMITLFLIHSTPFLVHRISSFRGDSALSAPPVLESVGHS